MTTDADIKRLIILEVGDTEPSILEPVIDTIWDSYADKASVMPRLQELYTKRRCQDLMLQTYRNHTDFSMDGAIYLHLSQRTGYLTQRRKETQVEIDKWEAIARANRPGATGSVLKSDVLPEDSDRFRGAPVNRDGLPVLPLQ